MESVLGDDILVMDKKEPLKQDNQQGLYTAFSEFTNLFDDAKDGVSNESNDTSPSTAGLTAPHVAERAFNKGWEETERIEWSDQNTAGISFELDTAADTVTGSTIDASGITAHSSQLSSPADLLCGNEWNGEHSIQDTLDQEPLTFSQSASPVLGGSSAIDDESIHSARPLLLDPSLTLGSNQYAASPEDTNSLVSELTPSGEDYAELPDTGQNQSAFERDTTHLMPESAYWGHTNGKGLHLDTNYLEGHAHHNNDIEAQFHESTSQSNSVYQSAASSPVSKQVDSDLPLRKSQQEGFHISQEPVSAATELLRRRGKETLRPVSLRGSDYSPQPSTISPWSTFASPSSSRPSSVPSSSFQSPVEQTSNNDNAEITPLADHLQDMLHLLSPQNSTAGTPVSAADFTQQQQMPPTYITEDGSNMINTTTEGQDNIGVYATIQDGNWVDPNSIFQVGQMENLNFGETEEMGMMFMTEGGVEDKSKISSEDLRSLGERGGVPVHWQSQTTPATQKAAMARRKPWSVPKFECPYCSSTFTRLYNLKGHIRAHNNHRPYKCSESDCSKSFTRLHDLKRHESRTHGIRHQ